jgi:hypothetical protein
VVDRFDIVFEAGAQVDGIGGFFHNYMAG